MTRVRGARVSERDTITTKRDLGRGERSTPPIEAIQVL